MGIRKSDSGLNAGKRREITAGNIRMPSDFRGREYYPGHISTKPHIDAHILYATNPTTKLYRVNLTEEMMTIGILLADWSQSGTRDYITSNMNRFDKDSGKYIDLIIPGYSETVSKTKMEEYNLAAPEPAFILRRTKKAYYFDKDSFDDSVETLEGLLGFRYSCLPTLIFIEASQSAVSGLNFYYTMVLELSALGVEHTALVFDKIFEIAKETTSLKDIRNGLLFNCIRGKKIDLIFNALKNAWNDSAKEILKAVKLYKIEKKRILETTPMVIDASKFRIG